MWRYNRNGSVTHFLSRATRENRVFMFESRLVFWTVCYELTHISRSVLLPISDYFIKPFASDPQHVTMEDSYLCGYLKIKGLTEVRRARGQCGHASTSRFALSVWPAALVAVDLLTVYGSMTSISTLAVCLNGDSAFVVLFTGSTIDLDSDTHWNI